MSEVKIKNLRRMAGIARTKSNYGVSQISNITFSSVNKLTSDSKALEGKRVLRKKIYSKV